MRSDAIARADELFALPTNDLVLVLSKEAGWFNRMKTRLRAVRFPCARRGQGVANTVDGFTKTGYYD